MADRNNDTTRPDPESAGPERSRSRSLGRRIATTLVVCALLYLVGVGFAAVIPQVFSPETAELDPSLRCEPALRDLRAELLAFAGEHVARGGSPDPHAVRPFLRQWDLRHRALEARCDGEIRDTWAHLGQMRERLQGTLARFDAEEGALARRVDSTLARYER